MMNVGSSSAGKQNMFHFPVLLLLCSLLCDHLAYADPPYKICSNVSNYTDNSTFANNLNSLLNSLPSNASVSKLYNTSFGNDPDRVFALYMCLDYLSSNSCHDCIFMAQSDIVNICPNSKEAVVWEETCQLRYSNQNFFGRLNVDGNIPLANTENISDPEKFEKTVNETLSKLAEQAAFNRSLNMYDTGEVPFEDKDGHKCYLRYEFYPFYNGATSEASVPNNKGGGRKVWLITIIAIVSACLGILLLVSFVCLAMRKTKKKGHSEILGQHQLFHEQNSPNAQDYPYISLASIHTATNRFSDSNKLGEGGFGPVYKGVLEDGKESGNQEAFKLFPSKVWRNSQ
ncbi:hypothetical protein M0R45_012991 [Rubus argutus]|uniref:Gnk2-homologous domain-containing protein n=1 Tax=Rubus argutus TaxID=59490 RepID=A0AAW1XIA8_RUBAR